VPYLTPLAPKIKGGNTDNIIRYPLWTLKKRPIFSSADTSDRTTGPQTLSSEVKGKPELK
jgi:spore germination protein KA